MRQIVMGVVAIALLAVCPGCSFPGLGIAQRQAQLLHEEIEKMNGERGIESAAPDIARMYTGIANVYSQEAIPFLDPVVLSGVVGPKGETKAYYYVAVGCHQPQTSISASVCEVEYGLNREPTVTLHIFQCNH